MFRQHECSYLQPHFKIIANQHTLIQYKIIWIDYTQQHLYGECGALIVRPIYFIFILNLQWVSSQGRNARDP